MDAVLITNVDFPFGSAWSSRARSFVMLFCSCGYHVHVIAPQPAGKQNNDVLKGYDYSIEYVNYKANFLTLCGIGAASPFCNALSSYLKKHKVFFVFSNRMPFTSEQVSSVARSFGIPYILEQCEWFDPSSFKGGIFNPYYRKSEHQIKVANFKIADGVVAISRLFEKHYSRLSVIRIPTILDIQQINYSLEGNDDKVCHMILTGSIVGKKELLAPIFEAMAMIPSCKEVLHLDIYGPNKKQVFENISNNKELWNKVSDSVTIHGRIPQQRVEEKLREADYSIFIRPNRRSSDAGFPTKLAESMSVGTPVITNDTGDVSLYVNESTGYLLSDNTSESLIKVFESLIQKSKEETRQMRMLARKKAEESFDFRCYIELFEKFISSINKR